MAYSYPHGRPENGSNPDTGQGHPSNQHLLHYQHQQYPPAHHAIQAGYPGLRFAAHVNQLQDAGLLHGHDTSLVQPPRAPTSGSTGSSSRDSSHGSHEFENVLTNVMQGSNVQGHFQPEPAATTQPHRHGMPLQEMPSLPSSHPSPPIQEPSSGENYQIEDLSHATQTSQMITPTVGALDTSISGNTKSTQRASSTGRTPKKRAAQASNPKQSSNKQARSVTPMTQIVTPQRYQQPQELQQMQRPRERISFSKYCQTEPLFQDVYKATVHFAREGKLPDGLEILQDEEKSMITGVVATKDLEVGVEFGPFTGEFVKEGLGCFNPNTWEICVRGRAQFYIDGSKDPNNWMHHIRYARNTEEQNMEAFQVYGDIFFRLTKPIKRGTELRVFYSQEYRKHVGFNVCLDDLLFLMETQRFECRDCENRYTNSKSLFRHIKFEHHKENDISRPIIIEPATKTFPPNSKITNVMKINDVADKLAKDKVLNIENKKGQERTKLDKTKKFLRVKLIPLEKSSAEKVKNILSCKICRKAFPSEGHLKEHTAFHKEMKGLKPLCDVCGLECKNQKGLKQHKLSHNPDSLQCEKCKKYFTRKDHLMHHLRRIHKMSVGDTSIRGLVKEQLARYVGPGEEEEDVEEFHPELPKDMLGKQILIKSKRPKVFKCQFCPKKFILHNLVCRHEQTVHMNNGKFKCEFCSKTYMEEDKYLLHKRSHTKDRPFKCNQCPQSFGSERALTNHQSEHRGEKPFPCDVCGKVFRTRKYVYKHKRRQHMTPSRLFKCSFCDKTFKDRTGRERHERRHKGIRPHVCLTCGKAFGSKYSLQTHAQVHTGEKNFSCHICGQKFALNTTLVRHLLRHDKEPKAPDKLVIASIQESASVHINSQGLPTFQDLSTQPP